MKKTPPTATAAPASFWRPLALVALAANVVIATWAWHATNTPVARVAPATAATLAPGLSRPPALAPYVALGSYMAENNRIPDLGWAEPEFAAFLDGFRASYDGRGLPLDEPARRLRDDISQRVQAMLAAEQPDPLEEYFRNLREKEGATRAGSGLHYRITEAGSGPSPQRTDKIVISFAAGLPDGKSLAAFSRTRVKMTVQDLLPGVAEGVQLLRVGGKALVYVPPALSFSEANWPPQLPKGTPIVFFLELHEIVVP